MVCGHTKYSDFQKCVDAGVVPTPIEELREQMQHIPSCESYTKHREKPVGSGGSAAAVKVEEEEEEVKVDNDADSKVLHIVLFLLLFCLFSVLVGRSLCFFVLFCFPSHNIFLTIFYLIKNFTQGGFESTK